MKKGNWMFALIIVFGSLLVVFLLVYFLKRFFFGG